MIAEALEKLNKKREIYRDATAAATSARRAETDALNALNQAQRDFDKVVAEVRRDAPVGSDWKIVPPLRGDVG